jgi:DNA-binding GntR family transcriptional regulator
VQITSDLLDFSLVPKRVADVLEQDIIFGRLAPDSRVIEEEIAERFGVSRSPVRESIRLLERDGLIVRAERRGSRVSPMSRRDLDEVYACRVALEGLAAAEAAERHTPETLQPLQDGVNKLRDALASGEVAAYFTANVEFTDAVHRAADNITLKRLLAGIGKQALRYRFFAYRTAPELMSTSLEGNRGLVDAIRRRDKDAARHRTERLIEGSWKTVRKCLPA